MLTIETAFTPWASLAGGVLIGLAATLLMGLWGRVMGVTGLLSGLLSGLIGATGRDAFAWRAALLAGMMSGPALLWLLTGRMPAVEVPVTPAALVIGGLIVGVGVTFGSGCTSGHGVCGLARLSPRSAVATAVFMATTALTVHVTRHVIGG